MLSTRFEGELRGRLLPVVLGAVAALAVVSVAVGLQTSQPLAVTAPMFAAKTGSPETTPFRDVNSPRSAPYLLLPFSLLAAIIVYQTASRVLKRNEPE
jgi:hypothetical protein